VSIQHAPETIGMAEPGAKTVRKKNSSISMDMVEDGRADAVVAAATLKLRTLPGVDRAGIASALPNE
jgi:glycerol-3-phosphate acyltransferase PlsX